MTGRIWRCLAVAVALAMALSATGQAQQPQALTFTAELQGRFVAPGAVDTPAAGKATGVLVGDRFTVHGSFTGLSSPLRDLETKPNDPGIHLHRGAVGETTPYFHGLQVKLNADGRSGVFFGTATLDSAQKELLLSGRTYVDIHTVKYGPGEVRDQWRPLDPAAAAVAHADVLLAQGEDVHDPVVSTQCHR